MAHVLNQLKSFISSSNPFTFLNSRPHFEQMMLLSNLRAYKIPKTLDNKYSMKITQYYRQLLIYIVTFLNRSFHMNKLANTKYEILMGLCVYFLCS